MFTPPPPARPVCMGVINVTPDSFSDGGAHLAPADAIARAEQLVAEGARWIDVGGESTRPGAAPVDEAEELRRVVPVIAALRARLPGVRLSVDTRRTEVARAALAAGADVVNDVSAGRAPGMLACVAAAGAGVVLMHMRGEPGTMQRDTAYADLVGEVTEHLAERARAATAAGIRTIWLDPGLGFGKAPVDNPSLIRAIPVIRALGWPVVIGASRKRFIGELTGEADPARRVFGSVGAALAAASWGADVLRVHDVAATIAALQVFQACRDG